VRTAPVAPAYLDHDASLAKAGTTAVNTDGSRGFASRGLPGPIVSNKASPAKMALNPQFGRHVGMNAPGVGRRHGEHGILKYIESQTIEIERGLAVGVPTWMRANHYAHVMSGGLRVLRPPAGLQIINPRVIAQPKMGKRRSRPSRSRAVCITERT